MEKDIYEDVCRQAGVKTDVPLTRNIQEFIEKLNKET